jgi:hypothetical protein
MFGKIDLKSRIWGVRFLHHDKALAQSALQFLAKNNMSVIPHNPYTSDLVPCNIFLFLKLNMALKGRILSDVTMIKKNQGMHLLSFNQLTSGNTLNSGAIAGLHFERDSIS